MALRDVRGVPFSTAHSRSLERYELALQKLHGYRPDPLAVITDALAEDPAFVMGHCFRAALLLTTTEKGLEPELRASVEAAEALAHDANDRERQHIAAARAWLDGDFDRSLARYGALLVEYPRDAFALQVAHLCDFLLGRSTMLRDRVAAALPHWDDDTPSYGYVLGMYAFGLEECGEYGCAEDAGRRAVELLPRDVWAIHAVTHVMEMQGRLADGVGWMETRRDDWAADNSFAYHNWWHLALFHLDLGRVDRVLGIYDRAVRPGRSEVAMELVDATSLLWRLHLDGVEGGRRWPELADTWEPMAEDAYYAFNDMHAMMAFTAAGRPQAARRLLAALDRRAAAGWGTNATLTREIGLPICRAIAAFGAGEYARAVELLAPVRPIAHRFGGSHAQRDVVDRTLIEAALRAGLGRVAQELAAHRTAGKPSSPYNWTVTARARSLLGDTTGAHEAETQAAALRISPCPRTGAGTGLG